jgi:Tol biopolymer transport system component
MAVRPARRRVTYVTAVIAVLLLLGVGTLLILQFHSPASQTRLEYQQLTNFADSATSPALSPDGRMLAFIRGESPFLGPGQIYVKLLPNGEPLQLTHDDGFKMSPKFSPDGARITYTRQGASEFETWVVPVLGGKPRFLMANAEGLTWIRGGVLFSEMTGRGQQMGIITSQESRTEPRIVYMPPEESGMAHRSYLSPDGKQVLVVEMKFGRWLPCRLVPFDGKSTGNAVGPAPSQCTDAAWSPDGKWMYFSADTGTGKHIWRQLYPTGELERVTPSSATQEDGIEFVPDGRSFVTSIGTSQSTLWIHDTRGDRQITSEGFALLPSMSADGKKLFYLGRAGARSIVNGELWVVDLESGQRERLLPDFLMRHYSISADGQRLVFVAADDNGRNPVWLAALDRRSAPQRLTDKDARKAFTLFFYKIRQPAQHLPDSYSVS